MADAHDITEAEMTELLELMRSCTGISIKAPEVSLIFDDIFDAGHFFKRLHTIVGRRWERSDGEQR